MYLPKLLILQKRSVDIEWKVIKLYENSIAVRNKCVKFHNCGTCNWLIITELPSVNIRPKSTSSQYYFNLLDNKAHQICIV